MTIDAHPAQLPNFQLQFLQAPADRTQRVEARLLQQLLLRRERLIQRRLH